MESNDNNEQSISEMVASKIFAMNEKLDSIVQLAHSLEVQNKAMLDEDAIEKDSNKIVLTSATSNHQMLTSTPLRAKMMRKTPKWNSLTPAEQLDVLNEVANEHTKVSLDFDGLRRSIVAAQKVVALQDTFHLVRTSEKDKSNEEHEYVLELMDVNVETTKRLSSLMEDYTAAQIKSLELKTQLASEWSSLRHFYSAHFAECNDENDVTVANVTSSQMSTVEKKKSELQAEEKKCEQMKILTQKLMMTFKNLNIDQLEGPTDAKRFRETFAKCGKSIQQLKSEII